MDEAAASDLVAIAAERFRFLTGAQVRRVEPLGEHVGILVDHLDDQGHVQYEYAVVVAHVPSASVAFVVTADVSELAVGTSQPHFLGRFDDLGHCNHGRADFRDIEVFRLRAMQLVRERLDTP